MDMYRETWAEISLKAIDNNINIFRNRIKPSTKLCAVVKANAYGHGDTVIAKECEKEGVDYFAVALLEEGVKLRESGITKPILVLGTMPLKRDAAEACVYYDIDHAIFDGERLTLLNAAAIAQHKQAGIHIAVDTGMNRIGVRPAKAGTFASAANILPGIRIDGVFSHFATADSTDKEYAFFQASNFRQALQNIAERNIHIPIRHISNSAAMAELTQYQFDMVRQGITLYGIRPSNINDGYEGIQPAMSIKSRIVYLKKVSEGEYIGYGCTYRVNHPSIIATIPIGYADGIPRSLSNKGNVVIKGKKCPIVGRICMDQLMINVTEVPTVAVGDEVTIIGGQDIPMELVGQMVGTIPYEIICGISSRVPRVYK